MKPKNWKSKVAKSLHAVDKTTKRIVHNLNAAAAERDRRVFSDVVAISLRTRVDRRESLVRHLKNLPWPFAAPRFQDAKTVKQVKMVDGFMGYPEACAAVQSHLLAASQARLTCELGGLTMVLEDDVRFVPGFTDGFKAFMVNVPDDRDALMLGWYWAGIRPYEGAVGKMYPKGVARARFFFGLHCCIMREPILTAFVDELEHTSEPADWAFCRLMGRYKVYVPWPHPLAFQANGRSDITGAGRKLSNDKADSCATK